LFMFALVLEKVMKQAPSAEMHALQNGAGS
jgi:hypothetical protein